MSDRGPMGGREGGVYAGLRVVDASTNIAGPYATMFLADHGADVVKIEPPDGDPYRAQAGFQVLNRGKRSVVLDLDDDADVLRLLGLLAGADVFVTDRPQADIRQRGLGEAALRIFNPRLVIVGMPPFGEHGPYVRHRWSPGMVAAVGGTMGAQVSYSGEPVVPVIPAPSYGAGILAAGAIAAALYARESTGEGRFLEVSELAGALAVQIGTVTSDLIPYSQLQSPAMGPRGPVPPYALYQAGDGEWFFLACGTREFFDRMLVAIDRPELAADPRLRDAPWGLTSKEATEALAPVLEEVFRTQPREHWIALFRDADVPAQPVWSRDRFFESPLVREGGLRTAVQHPELGAIEMMGVPLALDGAAGSVAGHAPLLGAHTAEVLDRLDPAAIPAAFPETPPGPPASQPPLLDGVRVLDLATYIAGPVASRHLAMLGAEVLKVEPPTGDPFRVLSLGFQGWNLGKRSVGIDLQRERGRELFDELLADSDVLIENARPEAARRLGLAEERLRALNERLVHLTVSGFGDVEGYRDLPAFDPLLQALSGAMDAQGGDDEPVYSTVALSDVVNPLLSVFGICTALYRRAREGGGGRVRTSLAGAAMAAQAAEFVRYEGAPAPQRGGRDYLGPSAACRWYRIGPGHVVYLEAETAAQREALVRLAGLEIDPEALTGPADGPAAEALERHVRRETISDVFSVLQRSLAPFVLVTQRGALLEHDAVRANHLTMWHDHPVWGRVTVAGRLVHDPASGEPPLARAPMLAEHIGDVLEERGYDRRVDYLALAGDRVIVPPKVDVPPAELLNVAFRDATRLPVRQLWMVFNMDVG